MRQIKYSTILAMAMIFFLGQTNVAFSQAVPPCHYDDGSQRLLTTFDKYGYTWSLNGQYGPTPPSVPNPPPCPGVFMCISDTVTEATSCGACSNGDTTRSGKYFHIRNLTGGLQPLVSTGVNAPPLVIDSVEITGRPKPSANNVSQVAQVCYVLRNFGIPASPNNWTVSYTVSSGTNATIPTGVCFSPWTYVNPDTIPVFTVILTPAAADFNSHIIQTGEHLTTVIWGMELVTQVIIHYLPIATVVNGQQVITFPPPLIINYPTVHNTRCPDGTGVLGFGQ